MTTARLLWGMTWRGAAWGSCSGLAIGVIYTTTMFCLLALSISLNPDNPNDPIQSMQHGITVAIIFGLLVGSYGMVIGLGFGLFGGLLLGLVTRLFYFPLKDPNQYRQNISIWSAVGVLVLSIPFVSNLPVLATLGDPGPFDTLLWFCLPEIIVAVAIYYVSRRVVHWYTKTDRKE